MKLSKVIFINNELISKYFLSKLNLQETFKNDNFSVYNGNRELYKDEEELYIVFFSKFNSALDYVNEELDVYKVLLVGEAENLGNVDIKQGDIVLPNSFISASSDKTIFLDYAIGENYDLQKFQLILSGICISGKVNDDNENFYSDISDADVYDNLNLMDSKEGLLKKTVVIKLITGEVETNYENLYSISEFIL